ncbi:HAMP domain-containing histidine kinase [Candidatus Saccharibacteria bacterium]|nr:HAMP domain-containing histidine kinase [Candidatus Saccharibacteria bacterium]
MSSANHEQNNQKKLINQDHRISALKKQMSYYKEITETIREPFIILRKDLTVVTANLAFYQKFKVKKRDTEGKQIYDLGDNQWDAPELKELLENILPDHRILNNYAVTHNFPLLGTKTILLNARQVDSKQLILLAMEDVTAQWKLKIDSAKLTENLTKQRDQLQGLNDAKDEFISLASHQLRTPATVVKQYVGMLSHGFAGALTKEQLDMLGVAYRNNERQLEIIEDLLRVAKVDAGKVYLDKVPFDVVAMIETAVDGQSILFQNRGQVVIFNKPATKMIAMIDPKLMLMVLENILDNAGKYSDNDTSITITVDQNETDTMISFIDNGVGIRESDQKKLFKKFSRIDNPLSVSVKGTGLGLYWAKKVLDLHEGSIQVTSGLRAGSTFKIITPTASTFSQ